MALVPIQRLKKTELVWLASHRCKHSHTYINHYDCYLEDNPNKERVGFLDIETHGFKSDKGIMLTYCIKEMGKNKIYSDYITKKDLSTHLDKRIVKNLVRDLANFDRIIGYYSSGFDVKFIRGRAVALGIDFPEYGTKIHNDLYYIIRGKFGLSRNSLENACRYLLGETQKTHFDFGIWFKAIQGDAKSIKMILDHNKKDVLDTEALWKKVVNFSARRDASI